MDLRSYIKSSTQIETAKQLAIRGLLNYQPWIFSDDFETGVGLEWDEGEFVGLTYYPDIDKGLLEQSPELRRLVINPERYEKFHYSNDRLRRLYDGIADEICSKVDDVSKTSFLDVGCNTGYFPQSFALRGAGGAARCDREGHFSDTFALLNGILGTEAKFYNAFYDPKMRRIEGMNQHDIVLSMAVLCHLSEPLNHLTCLGALASQGLFVWTLVNDDDGYSLRYGEPSGDYRDDPFPLCFDTLITISEGLLRKSLELMGFQSIYEIPSPDSTLPVFKWKGCRLKGFLGLR